MFKHSTVRHGVFLVSVFLLFLGCGIANATVYSDGESGADGWSIFDATPPGASISAEFDSELQSNVVRLQGNGRQNRYLLGGTDAGTGWNNSSETTLAWKMKADEPFALNVFIETSQGPRRLNYDMSNANSLKNPGNDTIHFGLGSATIGAGWLTLERDLAEDVAIGEPGNSLLSIHGVVVLGSLRIDDVELGSGDAPVENRLPTAAISANASSGRVPLSVVFDAQGSTAVSPATLQTYAWDFGNGDTASSAGGSTTYTQTGNYSVTLTVTDSNGLSDSTTTRISVSDNVRPPVVDAGAAEAARLLAQASFGATLETIESVRRLGIEGWIDDQFTRQSSSQLEYAQNHPGSESLTGPRQHKWLMDAIDGEDQLRQRIAFAYSEIFVTSDVSQTIEREQYAMANYYDLLSNHAFGNYRDLLESVTLNPIMGLYLSMLQNAKANPASNTRADENFAREVMQLFSIGQHELNNDGSTRLDSSGRPIPAYTQEDVEEYARVFTGWTYADANIWDKGPAEGFTNKLLPMKPFTGFHDTGSKRLLGGVVTPAGISAEEDLQIALDSLFNHPNVGPFISKQLIQRLVTSNPTPAYTNRVASVFNNNGEGVRGDMRALIKAILVDVEAREGFESVPNFGKLREPLIRWTHLWRAFNVQKGMRSENGQYNHASPYIYQGDRFLGQSVLSAPSVFNFFHPDYAPLGPLREAGVLAPESEIYTDAFILTTTARLSSLTQLYHNGGNDNTRNNSYIDLTEETELADRPVELLSRLDLLLLSGQMSTDLRGILLDHLTSLPSDEQGRSQRVRDAISLIMASPEYLVQK